MLCWEVKDSDSECGSDGKQTVTVSVGVMDCNRVSHWCFLPCCVGKSKTVTVRQDC